MSATIYAVMAEARTCGLAMLENATFIQRELPNVPMSDELREQTRQVCDSLIGTKHDIFTELFELDELLSAKASLSVIHLRVNRIVKWFREDITRMHELVMALESTGKQDPACQPACVLVVESAANILNAFNRTKTAADGYCAEAHGSQDVQSPSDP